MLIARYKRCQVIYFEKGKGQGKNILFIVVKLYNK